MSAAKRALGKFKAGVHSVRRYNERFDRPITPAQRLNAVAQIVEGTSIAVRDDKRNPNRSVHLVLVLNKWRKCVYDSDIEDIVTFLPGGR